jgi:hypothetical protein
VFSASTTVECYLTTRLADITSGNGKCTVGGATCQSDEQCIANGTGFCVKTSPFSLGNLGTGSAFSRITPVDLDGGVIGIAEETHYIASASGTNQEDDPSFSAQAAWNLQQEGTRFDATVGVEGGPVVDTIVLPESGF